MKYTYRFWFFDPMDADAIVAYLGKMARKGWQADKAGWYFWRFRRAEPADLTYAVTYFPNASFYGGATTDEQDELAEYCAAAGWTYVTQMLRMQVFVTDRPDPVPLETDGWQKLEAVEAILKKDAWRRRLVWGFMLLAAALLIRTAVERPLDLMANTTLLMGMVWMPLLLLAMTVRLLARTIWLRRSRQLVLQWKPCAPSFFRLPRRLYIFSLTTAAVLELLGMAYNQSAGFPALLLRELLSTAIVLGVLWWMRERGFGEKAILLFPLTAAGLIAILLFPAIVRGPYPAGESPTPELFGAEEAPLPEDAVPLTMADLGLDSGGLPVHTEILSDDVSPLASLLRCRITCPTAENQSAPNLSYVLVHVASPSLIDLCLRDPFLSREGLSPVSDGEWQAEAVYADRVNRTLLIRWENAILRLAANKTLDLTGPQKDAIRETVLTLPR